MKNFYKFIVSKDYIDHNGHLTEWGYYACATKAIWNLNEDHGLLEVYKSYGFGPIMFLIVLMKRLIIILCLSLVSLSVGCSDDYQKGAEAYNNVDYANALKEWKTLAEGGDTDSNMI